MRSVTNFIASLACARGAALCHHKLCNRTAPRMLTKLKGQASALERAARREALRWYLGFLCFTLDLYVSPGLTSLYAQAGMLAGEGLGGVAQAPVLTIISVNGSSKHTPSPHAVPTCRHICFFHLQSTALSSAAVVWSTAL